MDDLPDDILEMIFLKIPATSLVKTVMLVSKRWNTILSGDIFWIEKSLHDKRLSKQVIQILKQNDLLDSKKFYFNNVFNRNLLLNPCGNEGFKHWLIDSLTGHIDSMTAQLRDKNFAKKHISRYYVMSVDENYESFMWIVENDQIGTAKSEPLLDQNNKLYKNFATWNKFTGKLQVIDLTHFVTKQFLANIHYKLEVKEYYAARTDCGSRYLLAVVLLDNGFNMVDNFTYEKRTLLNPDGRWKLATHVFEVDKPVRYLVFYHGGCDLKNWKGYYGSKMTNGSVRIII